MSILDDRCVYLVPPCDAEEDGELSVVGVRQSRALGDALGDASLKAVYAGPGLAAKETAAIVAQRHGLSVRRKPGLSLAEGELHDRAVERILEIFDTIARAGPGRTSLIVADLGAARVILSHCWEVGQSPSDQLQLQAGSITEITVAPARYTVERLGDTTHLPSLTLA